MNLLTKDQANKKTIKYVVTTSFGNDSVALIQYMHENHKGEFLCLYNDTGWARKDWPKRVAKLSNICFELGIHVEITKSIGMADLVRKKKGWPMPASAMQWCTQELKEKPSNEFYEKRDPFGEFIIVTGRRRAESQNRANLPLWQHESKKHGGRDVYNPIISFDEKDRDLYIRRFGVEPLEHSSMECYPCVCANKTDLAAMPLDDSRINFIEKLEVELGHTRNDKPRTMFRPYRVGGGVGIRQAVAWGRGERGFKSDYIPNEYKVSGSQTKMFESVSDVAYEIENREGRELAKQCDGGFCGN
jgi:3'-phosphoadenosine 5'-phosphosulfate sulfotransferase (PAPS reductase)/FAD synthetase